MGLFCSPLFAGAFGHDSLDDGVEPFQRPDDAKAYIKALPKDQQSALRAPPEIVEAWQDMGFGVFIHWDHSSQVPAAMSWGRKGARPRHSSDGKVKKGVPEQEYNELAKTFNPTQFDADAWVQTIKDAGAKYMVFTAKHHAGFSMFDSKVSEFDIVDASPYGKDVCKALAKACQNQGIKVGWYYSQPDWYHEDYRSDEHFDRYIDEFLYPQITELLRNYGKIDILWFDGLGKDPKTWRSGQMMKMIKDLQPEIMVNHRFSRGIWRFGDFDGPEQQIGRFQINRPWETCAVIGGRWGWGGNQPPMTFRDCIHALMRSRGNGGNLLLNTGPDGKGNIIPSHVDMYKRIGEWLAQYGEAYYNTRGGPFQPGPWGCSTRSKDGKTIYLTLTTSTQKLQLPKLGVSISKAEVMGAGQVEAQIKDGKICLDLNIAADPVAIVKLHLERELPMDMGVVSTGELLKLKTITASSEHKSFSLANLNSDAGQQFSEGVKYKKGWQPDNNDSAPWLELPLAQPQNISQLSIKYGVVDKLGSEVKTSPYEIEVFSHERWKNIHKAHSLWMHTGIVLEEQPFVEKMRIRFHGNKGIKVNDVLIYGVL
jgi:alpha-L-fucosidase